MVASYIFYGAATPWYCFLLLTSTLVDFFVAPRIAEASDQRAKKRLLHISIFANLGLLGLFKYGDFILGNINTLTSMASMEPLPGFNFILPVGISFYTFQTMAYTLDVYRGTQKPTKDLLAFALYVSYSPQLVAGPIERARNLLPQLLRKQKVHQADWVSGFQRILWGFVKKLVVSDRLGLMVHEVYAQPDGLGAPILIVETVCFTFQLYLDFSAYTDIAIGTARLMGVRLSENFNTFSFHWAAPCVHVPIARHLIC